MGWAAIIAAILEVFGPLLIDLVKRWLHSKLSEAALALEARGVSFASLGGDDDARRALFTEAIRSTRGPVRRELLRKIRDAAELCGVTRDGPAKNILPSLASDIQDFGGAAAEHE